ncbi:hypothetical protein [Methylovulum psychrotolerans]|nr:hypothetical protein [Methylovulum psychrotolerans]
MNIYGLYEKPEELDNYEKNILIIPAVAYAYAANQKKEDPDSEIPLEIEEVILKDAISSASYAIVVIKGRWEKGEHIISTNAYASYDYAMNAIQGRWEKGENAMRSAEEHYQLYSQKYL